MHLPFILVLLGVGRWYHDSLEESESFRVEVSGLPSQPSALDHMMTLIPFLIYFLLEDPAVSYTCSWAPRRTWQLIRKTLIQLPV